ncbi:SDR family oxidoreductase [Streptomyces sp. URMC 126]|uniref:SDR family oxidoreductase n=1 Tax=Streptomyces sp. URMC 126 TaxID=3423401 RepID=UPI003F1CF81C
MTHVPHHLVTGATGFVGGALVLELLARTDAEIHCVVRPRQDLSADERLRSALTTAAASYGITDLDEAIATRCHAVAGDLTAEAAGVDAAALPEVEQVWHVAASLAYEEHRREEILRDNLGGTQHVLELARALKAPTFNYVSTAYVAGDRTGFIPAERVGDGVVSNNAYEHSKIQAERAVYEAGFERTRIFRPSIVIGHSRTFAATSFTGLYGFVKGLQKARSEVRRSLGDMLVFRPLRLRATEDALVNFIPVDLVVAAAVGVALEDGPSDVYHLANTEQPSVGETLSELCDQLAIKHPVYVDTTDEFTLIDERVDERVEFYRSYVNGTKEFDVANVEKLLGEGVLSHPLPQEHVGEFIRWYLEHHRAKKGTNA